MRLCCFWPQQERSPSRERSLAYSSSAVNEEKALDCLHAVRSLTLCLETGGSCTAAQKAHAAAATLCKLLKAAYVGVAVVSSGEPTACVIAAQATSWTGALPYKLNVPVYLAADDIATATSWQVVASKKAPLQLQAGQQPAPPDWQQLVQVAGATWLACVPIMLDGQLAGMLMVVRSSNSAVGAGHSDRGTAEALPCPLQLQDLELIAMFLGQGLFKSGELQAAATLMASLTHNTQPDIKTLVCSLGKHVEDAALALCGLPLVSRIALIHAPSQQMVLFSKPGARRRSTAASSAPTLAHVGSGSTTASKARRSVAAPSNAAAVALAADSPNRSRPVRFFDPQSRDDISRSGSSSLWAAQSTRGISGLPSMPSGLPDASNHSQAGEPTSSSLPTRHVSSQLSGLPLSKLSIAGSGVMPPGGKVQMGLELPDDSCMRTNSSIAACFQEVGRPDTGKGSSDLAIFLTLNNASSLLASTEAAAIGAAAPTGAQPLSAATVEDPGRKDEPLGIDAVMPGDKVNATMMTTLLPVSRHALGHKQYGQSSEPGYTTAADDHTDRDSATGGNLEQVARCDPASDSATQGTAAEGISLRADSPLASAQQRHSRRGSPSGAAAVRRYASVTMPPAAEAGSGIPDHLPLIKAFTHQASAAGLMAVDTDTSVELPVLPASWPSLTASAAFKRVDVPKAPPDVPATAAQLPTSSVPEQSSRGMIAAEVPPNNSAHIRVPVAASGHPHTDLSPEHTQASRTRTGVGRRHRLSHVLSQPPQGLELQGADTSCGGSGEVLGSEAAASMLDAVALPLHGTLLQRALNHGRGLALSDVHKVLQQRAAAPYRDVLQLQQAGGSDLGSLLVVPYLWRLDGGTDADQPLCSPADNLTASANPSMHARRRRSSGVMSAVPPTDLLMETGDSAAASSPRRSPNTVMLRSEPLLAVYMLHPYPLPSALLKQLRAQLGALLQSAGPTIREQLTQGAEWHSLVTQLQGLGEDRLTSSSQGRSQQALHVGQNREVPRRSTFPSVLTGYPSKALPDRAQTDLQAKLATANTSFPGYLQLVAPVSSSHDAFPAPDDRPSPFLQPNLQYGLGRSKHSSTGPFPNQQAQQEHSNTSAEVQTMSPSLHDQRQMQMGAASSAAPKVWSAAADSIHASAQLQAGLSPSNSGPSSSPLPAVLTPSTLEGPALRAAQDGVLTFFVGGTKHVSGRVNTAAVSDCGSVPRSQSWSMRAGLNTGQHPNHPEGAHGPAAKAMLPTSGPARSSPGTPTTHILPGSNHSPHPSMCQVSVLGPELSLAHTQDAGRHVQEAAGLSTSGVLSFRLEPAAVLLDDDPVQAVMAGLQKSLSRRRRSHMLGQGDPMLRPQLSGLHVMERVGCGAYGTVYRGVLDGQEVAVKVVPAKVSNDGAHSMRASAIQRALELTVGSIATHINLVQVVAHFTNVRVMQTTTVHAGQHVTSVQLEDSSTPLPALLPPSTIAQQPSSSMTLSGVLSNYSHNANMGSCSPMQHKQHSSSTDSSFMQYKASVVVMEYCDEGSLADAIRRGAFKQSVPGGWGATVPHMPALIATLLELAVALRHLHGLRFLHGDVKASNVLLRSSPRDARGFTTKLGDLGLVSMLVVDDDGQLVVPSHDSSHQAGSGATSAECHSGDSQVSLNESPARGPGADSNLQRGAEAGSITTRVPACTRTAAATSPRAGHVAGPAHANAQSHAACSSGAISLASTKDNVATRQSTRSGIDGLMVLSATSDDMQHAQERVHPRPSTAPTTASPASAVVSQDAAGPQTGTPPLTQVSATSPAGLLRSAAQHQYAAHSSPYEHTDMQAVPAKEATTQLLMAELAHTASDVLMTHTSSSCVPHDSVPHDERLPASSLLGTLTHMAPEVLAHEQRGAPSDIYSFGILMAELVLGCEVVYLGLSSQDISHGVRSGSLRPTLPEYVPEGYRQLAASCWAHDPAARPTCGDLVAALKGLAAHWPLMEPAGRHHLQSISGGGGAAVIHTDGDVHSTPSLYSPHWYPAQRPAVAHAPGTPADDTMFPLHIL